MTRRIWLVKLFDGEYHGVGECAPLPDLSCDAMSDEQYKALLQQFCEKLCETGEIDYSLVDNERIRKIILTLREIDNTPTRQFR